MIKKLLLAALFIGGSFAVNAQCVINTGLTSQGFYPDSVTNLPYVIVTLPYNTDIQFRVPQDTVLFGLTVNIDSIHIDGVTGLLPGFTYTPNPVSGTVPGNSNGCLLISGTAVVGDELGGPTSNGEYPLIINYTSYVTVPFVGSQAIPQINDDYRLKVTNPIGLNSILSKESDVISYPNPANDQLAIEFVSNGGKSYTLEAYNYMGQLVSNQTGSAKDGVNKITLTTSSLANGTYIYKLNLGNTKISKTISVQH